MTNWTTIATTAIAGASGLFGAGLGYLGARLHTKGEGERLREQHREDHLRHRQGVYHDLLDVARGFVQTLSAERFAASVPGSAAEDIDVSSITAATKNHARFLDAYTHALNAALLFAMPDVRVAVECLDEERSRIETAVERELSADLMRRPGRERFRDRFFRIWARIDVTGWQDAMNDLLDAMHSDVAPEVSTPTRTGQRWRVRS